MYKEINTGRGFLQSLKSYENGVVYVCADHGLLCLDCAKENQLLIARTIEDKSNTDWLVVAEDKAENWHTGTVCDHCGTQLT